MQNLEIMTVKQLYRGILKRTKKYPSINRDLFRKSIIVEVNNWKQLKDELEI